MTRQEFSALTAGTVLLDGATGSVLLRRGMPRGTSTELWVDRHPEVIRQLQEEYVQAGSQILYAPTFQAQPAPPGKSGVFRERRGAECPAGGPEPPGCRRKGPGGR